MTTGVFEYQEEVL